jgi:hypothetical protein
LTFNLENIEGKEKDFPNANQTEFRMSDIWNLPSCGRMEHGFAGTLSEDGIKTTSIMFSEEISNP